MTTLFCLLQCATNYYSQTRWFRNRLRFLGWSWGGRVWKEMHYENYVFALGDATPFMKTLANQSTEETLTQFWGKHLPAVEAQEKKDASCSGAKKGGGRKWELNLGGK